MPVDVDAIERQIREGMDHGLSLAARRRRGLDDLSRVIQELYGARCSRRYGGCACCAAWTLFDAMAKLTETSE